MVTFGTPEAEYPIDTALVRQLLQAQHPDLADLPLQEFSAGWDNVMFRLGADLLVRMPRRQAAAALIVHEQTWVPLVQEFVPLRVPVALRVGQPMFGYPWRWSVLPWLDGHPADLHPPAATEAAGFGGCLRALHRPAPLHAPHNAVRGVPLHTRQAAFAERTQRLAYRHDLLTPKLFGLWERALAAPQNQVPCWIHGDLHPRNLLVDGGRICAIIDWGDITGGDPATDLAGVWALFADREAREAALAAYAPDPALLDRARGWAILFGLMYLGFGSVDDPRFAAIGEQVLRRVLA